MRVPSFVPFMMISFVGGVLVGSLSGVQTSILPQSASAANVVVTKYEPPVVNSLDPEKVIKEGYFGHNEGMLLRLDGINCERCVFEDEIFEYGGGAINCLDCRFTNPGVKVRATGAAWNTVQLLRFIESQKPAPAPQIPPWLANPNPKIEIALNTDPAKQVSLVLPGTNH